MYIRGAEELLAKREVHSTVAPEAKPSTRFPLQAVGNFHQRSLRHGAEGYTNAVIKGVIAGGAYDKESNEPCHAFVCLLKVHSHKLIIKEPLS